MYFYWSLEIDYDYGTELGKYINKYTVYLPVVGKYINKYTVYLPEKQRETQHSERGGPSFEI